MAKFSILSKKISENSVKITGDEYKHIVKVLRYKEGDKLELFDENFITHQAVIKSISSKQLIAEIYDSLQLNNESELNINLFQAIPKGNKMDFIVQKSTELGVKSITPIYTERTVVQQTTRIKRWSKISLESCKQSGRNKPVYINDPLNYMEILKILNEKDVLNILFYENKDNTLKTFLDSLNRQYSTVNLIIGPEGGFTENEIKKAENQKINILGLGPRILRTETAAIAAVSVIQFYMGDL
ncbi:MAG: 16S rRNA (uracil(1498)-N(3))-methyltransferase [Thermodesulfobacteriota bacterium]